MRAAKIQTAHASEEQQRHSTAARRMAVECRRIIQGCLREEEWQDADQEFAAIILAGLSKLVSESCNSLPPSRE